MPGLANSEINGARFPEFTVDIPALLERMNAVPKMCVSDVFERIYKGSMPRLYENEAVDRELYYESYLETYLSRDLKDLAQVGDETAFLNFMAIVAARTATNVNYETLASEVGVSAPTVKQWLSILTSSGIVALIQPFSNNALKRVVKAPRMYFLDTGLCARLTRWTSAETLERGAMDGAFFETWVVSEIYKSYLNQGKTQPPLYFYRDGAKKEIDLIIYQDCVVHPVTIKKGSAPKNATKNFSALDPVEKEQVSDSAVDEPPRLKTKIGSGAVVCLPPDIIPIDKKNWYVPAWII